MAGSRRAMLVCTTGIAARAGPYGVTFLGPPWPRARGKRRGGRRGRRGGGDSAPPHDASGFSLPTSPLHLAVLFGVAVVPELNFGFGFFWETTSWLASVFRIHLVRQSIHVHASVWRPLGFSHFSSCWWTWILRSIFPLWEMTSGIVSVFCGLAWVHNGYMFMVYSLRSGSTGKLE